MGELKQMLAARDKSRAASVYVDRRILVGIGVLTIVYMIVQNYTDSMYAIVAAIFAGYMAMNIGANDVANNVGPAVGSSALTLGGAIVIAAIFEASGALIAGGDVVSTVKKGIINPDLIKDGTTFIWLMMAALLAGGIWLNIATSVGAPVSTTHSIVGGVLGAGIVAAGSVDIVNWAKMGQIAASWVISPVLGGIIAAGFLYFIKRTITYRKDMLKAAQRIVPILIAVMTWVFATYIILKGLKKIWKVEFGVASLIGSICAILMYFVAVVLVRRAIKKRRLVNDKASVNVLFNRPLIFGVALLSFAHGANDVANAIGPLAAIIDTVSTHGIPAKAAIPIWVMVIGALGIVVGLALYGPKLIRTVGSEITELDQMRAFCIALAAAITVIIASQMGLPVSSTHIAVGAVFGIGFLREYIKADYKNMINLIESHHQGSDRIVVEGYLSDFQLANLDERKRMLEELKRHEAPANLTKKERKILKRKYSEQLVKRDALYKISAAWVITVPASGILAATIFFMLRGMFLP